MLRPSLQDTVFRKTIPHPKQNDPTSFFVHVQRNLVPEVRLEVQTFYGSLDCIEAQYPGLDYTYGPHRRRLSRYPWHRRLFRTFDELRLTNNEILSLCQWEGTRSARERYEEETDRVIRDTTADCVTAAPAGSGPRAWVYLLDEADQKNPAISPPSTRLHESNMQTAQSDDDEMNASVGMQLNQQLQAAVEARSRGEQVIVDAQWEQWMKEAMERNGSDQDTLLQAIFTEQPGMTNEAVPSEQHGTLPTNMMTPASSGTPTSVNGPQPSNLQRFDELREMLRDLQSANNQLSAENAALATFLSRSQPETAR